MAMVRTAAPTDSRIGTRRWRCDMQGRLAAAGQVGQPTLRLFDAALVGLVLDDLAVQLDRLRLLAQAPVVNPGRPEPRIELRVGVPLEAALEVDRRPAELAVRLRLVQLTELVGDVADLVALRVSRQDLLQQKLGALLVEVE